MFNIEKEKERLSKDNYKRKTNLPKRLQQVYDTLMDNGIEVSNCYWEYEDAWRKSDGGQWWFEFGGTLNDDDWDAQDWGCGTITGSNTEVVDQIKRCGIVLHNDETSKNYNPYTKEKK